MGGGDQSGIHFVFVHGASHGAWCWYKLITLLEAAGFKSSAVDLTGAGINLTDSNSVLDSDQYNRPLFTLLSELPPDHKVILVGHSAGGGTVTEALCKFTDKISMAIYVAAAMVQPGSVSPSFFSTLNAAENEEIWEYIYGEGTDKPPTAVIMKEEYRRHYYYSQSPLEDVTLSSKLARPAPVKGLTFDTLPPNAEAEKVPRVYMKTGKDNLFDSVRQDRLVEDWPPSQFYILEESDHSPFFSVPTTLFAYLLRAVSFLQP